MSSFVHSRQYYVRMRRRSMILFLLMLLVLASFIIDIATGPGNYSLQVVWDVLWQADSHGSAVEVSIRDYRLPIAVMAVLIGAMLATAGAQMQTLLDNPLAEPFTLGIAAAPTGV